MAVNVSCPICGANNTRFLFTKEHCEFVECRNDKMAFITPQPDPAALKDLYDNYGKECFTQPEYTADYADFPDYRKKFLQFRKINRLLEIGASSGNFLIKCREDGWQVEGVELSGPSSEYARTHRGLNVRTGTVHAAKLAAGSFDIVVAWATIEHVTDPREVIAEAFRLLRPGGLFVFSVPNWGGMSYRFLGPKHRYIGHDHLFYFSEKNSAMLLKDIGFRTVRTHSRDFNPFVFWQDWRGLLDQELKTHDDPQRSSRALALKRSEQPQRKGLLRIIPRPLLSFGYHLLSKTVGKIHLGDILFVEGVK